MTEEERRAERERLGGGGVNGADEKESPLSSVLTALGYNKPESPLDIAARNASSVAITDTSNPAYQSRLTSLPSANSGQPKNPYWSADGKINIPPSGERPPDTFVEGAVKSIARAAAKRAMPGSLLQRMESAYTNSPLRGNWDKDDFSHRTLMESAFGGEKSGGAGATDGESRTALEEDGATAKQPTENNNPPPSLGALMDEYNIQYTTRGRIGVSKKLYDKILKAHGVDKPPEKKFPKNWSTLTKEQKREWHDTQRARRSAANKVWRGWVAKGKSVRDADRLSKKAGVPFSADEYKKLVASLGRVDDSGKTRKAGIREISEFANYLADYRGKKGETFQDEVRLGVEGVKEAFKNNPEKLDEVSSEMVTRLKDKIAQKYAVDRLRVTYGKELDKRGITSLEDADKKTSYYRGTTSIAPSDSKAIAGLRRMKEAIDSADESLKGGEDINPLDLLSDAYAAEKGGARKFGESKTSREIRLKLVGEKRKKSLAEQAEYYSRRDDDSSKRRAEIAKKLADVWAKNRENATLKAFHALPPDEMDELVQALETDAPPQIFGGKKVSSEARAKSENLLKLYTEIKSQGLY